MLIHSEYTRFPLMASDSPAMTGSGDVPTVQVRDGSGRQLLRTPAALRRWLSHMGVGPAPSPAEVQQRGVFRGRGQRLGAS